jgi:hypothetical protein
MSYRISYCSFLQTARLKEEEERAKGLRAGGAAAGSGSPLFQGNAGLAMAERTAGNSDSAAAAAQRKKKAAKKAKKKVQ